MDRVKDLPQEERHIGVLTGLLQQRMRGESAEPIPAHEEGLRLSHLRVLGMVPPEGVGVTGLAARCGMTVQGAGQLVTVMVDSGHLEVQRDTQDGRRRRVHRTARGHDLVLRSAATVHAMEERWAREVGVERYAVFRGVLEQLALDRPEEAALSL
jgi:DNA-binding MarR family transcriptional regulator